SVAFDGSTAAKVPRNLPWWANAKNQPARTCEPRSDWTIRGLGWIHLLGGEMSALSGMDRAALDYVRANNLPASGWVCFHLGRAVGWSAEKPRLESIVPLTIVVNVETGIRDVARGGDSENGAEYWDSDPVSASVVESPEAGKTYTCKHS